MENKLPVVYVARELRGYKNFSSGIRELAYFVSEAYLNKKILEYKLDGSTEKQYFVIFNAKNCKNVERGLYVEYEPKTTYHIFYNYNDCKKYVDVLNRHLFSDRHIGESAYEIDSDIKYAYTLEKRYNTQIKQENFLEK